jgi:sugar phosphate isomerase/epimerase
MINPTGKGRTMMMTRRIFVRRGATALAGAALLGEFAQMLAQAAPGAKIRLGSRTSCFGGDYKVARQCGLEGVEIGVGGAADTLHVADPAELKKQKELAQTAGVVISSLSMDLMNGCPVATEPRAVAWLGQCIAAAKSLSAVGILVPFFGKAHLLNGADWKKDDLESVVKRLKEVAPQAEAAGVTLGIECTLPSAKYLEILDRIGSKFVGAYYDVGNTTNAHYDVPSEIRALKGRISQFHFKDGGNYLGEGKVKFEPIAAALRDIDYRGWVVLETSCPTKNGAVDGKKNADFVHQLLGI